jgi:hypothetical protein
VQQAVELETCLSPQLANIRDPVVVNVVPEEFGWIPPCLNKDLTAIESLVAGDVDNTKASFGREHVVDQIAVRYFLGSDKLIAIVAEAQNAAAQYLSFPTDAALLFGLAFLSFASACSELVID